MKMIYEAPKGWRVKNRMMFGVTLYLPEGVEENLWWHYDKKEWVDTTTDKTKGTRSTMAPVKSYRAFRRHIKRKCKDLPKGTRIVLVSRYCNANIIHIKK